jgi:dephospho-CoA kinase
MSSPAVKRVLLTGMSGAGKSSVVRELAALGYKAVDTDDGWCEPLLHRIATRTDNPYGKSPDERRRFLEDVEAVEPLLREVATAEIRTGAPLGEVVTAVLAAVGER